jgi:hypothetical protein
MHTPALLHHTHSLPFRIPSQAEGLIAEEAGESDRLIKQRTMELEREQVSGSHV